MLTHTLPVPLNARAAPSATPMPVPVPPPPATQRVLSVTSHSRRSQPLNEPCTRTQSSPLMASQISAASLAVEVGFCPHQRALRSC